MSPDLDLAWRLFGGLREIGFDGAGMTRDAYGPGERAALSLVREAALGLGLECRGDAAGNLYMTLPGSGPDGRAVLIGSHLDTVPAGGAYDGAAGVLAGLAVIAGMRRAGFVPARPVTVMVTRAEEAGAWFPVSFPGSRAALGTLPAGSLEVCRRDTGRTMASHMADEGLDPTAIGPAVLGTHNVAGFVELHIEQGPVLDTAGIPVGVVTAIPGSRRYRQGRILGESNHSGATPRAHRRDAALALAELVVGLDQAWQRLEADGHRLVVTFCVMGTTEEAGFTRIAGEARFQLDLRSASSASLDAIDAAFHTLAQEVAARRSVRVEPGPVGRVEPVGLDGAIGSELAACATALGIAHVRMVSGGGHDAGAFASAGVPASMLFVRNQNGSHTPREAMRPEDFADACAVLSHWAALRATNL